MQVLFDSSSIAPTGLEHFTIGKQVTVSAIGIPVGVEITFEMVHIAGPSFEPLCDAACPDIPAVQMPTVTAKQKLMCCDNTPVRVTSQHPYAVLNAPQGARIQATMAGYDFSAMPFQGVVTVQETETVINPETSQGCCETTTPCTETTTVVDVLIDCPDPIIGYDPISYIARTTTTVNTCTGTTAVTQWRLANDTSAPWLTTAPC